MKKQWFIPVFATLLASSSFTSCTENPQSKMPTAAVTSAPAPTAVVATEATVIANLTDAFQGETTASAKYAAYSKKALEEGYPQIAMLFKAASASEQIHANNHKSVLEEMKAEIPVVTPTFTVKSSQENLQDAIAGESYEITTMYPEFLANAKTVGSQLALISLNYAYKTEQKHKVLYDKALAALQGNQVKDLSMVYYVCPTCGNTYDTTPPKRCGISMTGEEKFISIAKV
jgi:rubrerythrin